MEWLVTKCGVLATVTLAALGGCDGCRRTPAASDAASDAAPAVVLDGAAAATVPVTGGDFAATRDGAGATWIATLDKAGRALGVVTLNAAGAETSRRIVRRGEKLGAPAIHTVAEGAFVGFQEGGHSWITFVDQQGNVAAPERAAEHCTTEGAAVFRRAGDRRVWRWRGSEPPEPLLDTGSVSRVHAVCGRTLAMALGMLPEATLRRAGEPEPIKLAPAHDSMAFYTDGDDFGVVTQPKPGTLTWITVARGEQRTVEREISAPVRSGLGLAAVDGRGKSLAALYSGEDARRCPGEEAPVYAVALVVEGGTSARVVDLPPPPCDRDSSFPEIAHGAGRGDGVVVRWTDEGDEGPRARRLFTWRPAEGTAPKALALPDESVVVDCPELDCGAVTRVGDAFALTR